MAVERMDTPDAARPPEGPERKESSVAESVADADPSAAVEAIGMLEARLASAPNELLAAGTAVERMAATPDLLPTDVADDPDIDAAKNEMAAVVADGAALVSRTKQRAGGLLSRMRKFAGAAGVAAAMSFLEACATMGGGAKPEAGIEHVEKGDQKDAVAEKGAESVRADSELAKQCTPEQAEAFAETIGRWNGHAMDRALADIAGLDPAELKREGIREIRMLSDAELKSMHDKDPHSVDLQMKAVTTQDRVLLRASAFVGADGKVDRGEVMHTIGHESLHGEHTRSDQVRFGEQVRPWDEVLPHGLQEGVTEVVGLRGLERLGEKPKDQSYAGGNFAAAFLLEKMVGTKALARDYLKGTTDLMRGQLTEKFGDKGADRVLRKRFYSGMGATGNEPEALSTAVDIIREAKRAGMDVEALVGSAAAEGVVEQMKVVGDGEGIVLSKELPGSDIKVIANAAVEDQKSLTPNSPPVRVHVLSQGAGTTLAEFDAAAVGKKVRAGAETVERVRAEFLAQHKLPENFDDDPGTRAVFNDEVDRAFAAQKLVSSGETFNLVVNAAEAMRPFRDAYDKATSAAERDAVRQQMADEVERIAKDVLVKVAAAAEKPSPGAQGQ